jgi:hypothetical protein
LRLTVKGIFVFIAFVLLVVGACAFPPAGIPFGLIAAVRLFAYLGKD